ncbi:LamB/YcsF family protein [Patiriisocius hiemis]|uniref:LamB/YcsF family protein n=1 Tax=Patiriisocius hiemis TaxID=3075604 RepID=A0ABU2YA52_9FLAO|nr:LamB/YcsF family protein [Constantimarinum sp. W242]MDT0555068.1 LamB/YcsF family protein [Constantimarinum sp. W242]
MNKSISINADLGEGGVYDETLMPYINSCNIACGGHFGTKATIKKTLLFAKEYNVKSGAHPSFPDTDNFGRKVISITKQDLKTSILEQLLLFYKVCKDLEVEVNHVKPHGALYNYAAIDAPTADAIVEAILDSGKRPILYTLENTILHKKAENLMPIHFEAFIDRTYTDIGALVSRKEPHALITNPDKAWTQFYNMVVNKIIVSESGNKIPCNASTFCIHSDTENSVEILKYIVRKAEEHNITLQ